MQDGMSFSDSVRIEIIRGSDPVPILTTPDFGAALVAPSVVTPELSTWSIMLVALLCVVVVKRWVK